MEITVCFYANRYFIMRLTRKINFKIFKAGYLNTFVTILILFGMLNVNI